MRFSERIGYAKPRVEMQIESMDTKLKNRIWNEIDNYIFEGVEFRLAMIICKYIWSDFYKLNISDIELGNRRIAIDLVANEYRNLAWNEIYELIEFIAEEVDSPEFDCKKFEKLINKVLEEEYSGYRMISGEITPITNENQIEEINKATESTNAAGKHIENAISNLSDKTNPDYRTAIKESIDAVESICKQITKESADMNAKTTLGTALKELKKHGFDVHSALIDGWSKIYGYASDGGIRHDLEAGASFDQEDAIYFLSTCAAFVNYLKVKADKHGINLE